MNTKRVRLLWLMVTDYMYDEYTNTSEEIYTMQCEEFDTIEGLEEFKARFDIEEFAIEYI